MMFYHAPAATSNEGEEEDATKTPIQLSNWRAGPQEVSSALQPILSRGNEKYLPVAQKGFSP